MMLKRTQLDLRGDDISLATGIAFDPDDDQTRQEFKEECDINTILARFGAGDVRPVRFGESVDADLDLLTAINAVRDAQDSFEALPQSLTSRYRDISSLVDALNRGELQLTSEPPQTPAGPDGVSPSGNDGAPPAGA